MFTLQTCLKNVKHVLLPCTEGARKILWSCIMGTVGYSVFGVILSSKSQDVSVSAALILTFFFSSVSCKSPNSESYSIAKNILILI